MNSTCRRLCHSAYLAIILLFLPDTTLYAQINQPPRIDPGLFADNANHWYSISDKGNIVNARPGRPKYTPTDLGPIGDNILLLQKDNGGWPKNYDIMAIFTTDQKDSLARAKSLTNTTFDNGSTYTHVAALATVYSSLKADKYKDAALKGLEFILSAQYENGGWPQYYPLENNYSKAITYNDGNFVGIMSLLRDIVERKPQYNFIGNNMRKKVKAAFAKAVPCILNTQINDAGKPTAWCQQYNEVTLQPVWARAFEPASICNKESADLVLFLMSLDHPDRKIIAAVRNAVAWFNESKIYNTRVKTISAPKEVMQFRTSATDKVVVTDTTAPPIWTRFYELKTHRPIFCDRDSKIVYSLAEIGRERRDGYGWYTYDPQKVLDKYPAWEKKWVKG
jgi:PelA/Pel-15E family pectate lyase